MKNVLKILCLYKQHYLNNYSHKKTAEYSCFGYYDCIEVIDVKDFHNNRLMMGKGNRNLADMWYQLGKQIACQNGNYMEQNIGLFRYDEPEKWEEFENRKEVFFCVCMIQVKEERQKKYKKVADDIEKLEFSMDSDDALSSVLFRTLDNEDYILLIKSNSYKCIVNYIETVRKVDDIEYTHSICGISEEYLEYLEKAEYDFESVRWDGGKLKDDLIAEVAMNIVLNSGADVDTVLSSLTIDGEWAYILGHSDVVAEAKNIKMSQVIKLLKKYTGIDHSNPLYGRNILNIETDLITEKKSFSFQPLSVHGQASSTTVRKWCELKIGQLRKNYDEICGLHDETFMAFYEAMIQSLNMLAPYEGSKFSRDVFYMIFPAIRLFYQQLDSMILDGEDVKLERLEEKVREKLICSITQFMDAVDPIIYRSVHGEQNFLSVPGYAGVIFSIPAKLGLMYMAYAWKAIDILNDSGENEYVCCIKPMVNARTRTEVIDFTSDPSKRLILIEISHRLLYMPRTMLMTLSHEIGHFSGDKVRMRKLRLECIIKSLAYVGAEAVFDMKDNKKIKKLFKQNKSEIRHHIVDYLYGEMKKKIEESRPEIKYHFENVSKLLKKICSEIYIDKDGYLDFKLYRIENISSKKMRKWSSQNILNVVKRMDDNISSILSEGYMQECIDLLESMFKEPYVDVVMMLLHNGCPWEYYFENFFVAEGREKVEIDLVHLNRWSVVVETICGLSDTMNQQWKELVSQCRKEGEKVERKAFSTIDFESAKAGMGYKNEFDKIALVVTETEKYRCVCNEGKNYRFVGEKKNMGVKSNTENCVEEKRFKAESLLNFAVIWEYQKDYLNRVGEGVQSMLENNRNAQKLQEFFKIFFCYEKEKDYQYNAWFEKLDELIADYIGEVEELLNAE